MYYGAAVLLHFIVPSIISVKYLQTNKVQAISDVKRDAYRSLLPIFIKGISLFLAETLHRSGYGVMRESPVIPMFQKMFEDPTEVMSIVALWFLLDLFHDTWFYFAHRALHCRWVLRNVHYMHHQSTTPSAFSGYSFHWYVRILTAEVCWTHLDVMCAGLKRSSYFPLRLQKSFYFPFQCKFTESMSSG